jgi:hypothetical protein
MNVILEKILKDFIDKLYRARKSELRNEFIDRISRVQMETITFDELFDNFGRGIDMNFFPSDKPSGCYEVAIFVSFHKSVFDIKLKKDQMISLDDVLKKLVQQVLGTCYPTNQKILLLTDKVDTEVLEPWLGNLKAIKRMGMELEIVYLRSDGSHRNVNSLFGL